MFKKWLYGWKLKEAIPLSVHRSYRHIEAHSLKIDIQIVFMILLSIITVLIYLFFIHNKLMDILLQFISAYQLHIPSTSVEVYGFPLKILEVRFHYNDYMTEWYLLIGNTSLIVLLAFFKFLPLNMRFWFIFFLSSLEIFIIYFIFLGNLYPYSPHKYFRLYLYAYVAFSGITTLLFGILIAILPFSFILKIFIVNFIIIYYWLFGFLRFIATQMIVSEYSVIFSPFLYFTIFYDFLAVVMFYAYILKWLNTFKKKGF